MKEQCLIICIGNEIRSDDGVAIRLASELEKMYLPSIKIIVTHQLTPELAETISKYEVIIFIDASVDEDKQVTFVPLQIPTDFDEQFSIFHSFSPIHLLSFSNRLFGKYPKAYLLKIPVINLDFGTEIHPETRLKMIEAIKILENFLSCKRG